MTSSERSTTDPVESVSNQVKNNLQNFKHHRDGDAEIERQLSSNGRGCVGIKNPLGNCKVDGEVREGQTLPRRFSCFRCI